MRLIGLLLFSILIFVIGTAVGFNLPQQKEKIQQTSNEKFPFLARRIFIDNPNDAFINFSPLRAEIREYSSKKDFRASASIRGYPPLSFKLAAIFKEAF